MKESIKCVLQILSPVHLGCDEVYEPTGFVLDEEAQQLVVFDPLSFLARMSKEEKESFFQICSKGTISSILEIFKLFQGKKANGRAIDICPGLVEHYHKTLSIPLQDQSRIQQELNNFTMARTAFLPSDERPYIPGSAIKGALRTAYLNSLTASKKVPQESGKGASKKLEKSLLDGGEFATDPFRMVKVSDFRPIGECKTRIVYAVNEKKVSSKFEAKGPYQILEVIEPGTQFEGAITVEEPERKAGIKSPISLNRLLRSAVQFYTKEKDREDGELSRIGISGVSMPDKENGFLVRLGRHSGAESITVNGYRSIKVMKGRGEKPAYENHATTLWLASEVAKPTLKQNLRPFGWAVLRELAAALAEELEVQEEAWRNEAESKRIESLAEKQNELKTRREEQQEMAQEAERRASIEEQERKEAERRKKELEAMTPEESDIALVRNPKTTENQVVEIYNRMDGFSEENKKTLASAFRTYWEASGKWEKKQCTKKQWAKVQKIKGILGER